MYKVISATNNKIYALKKVSFDKADATAIAGYKNEIRLLNRMAERESQSGGDSRCIRLYDWESCDDKGYLLMVETRSHFLFSVPVFPPSRAADEVLVPG